MCTIYCLLIEYIIGSGFLLTLINTQYKKKKNSYLNQIFFYVTEKDSQETIKYFLFHDRPGSVFIVLLQFGYLVLNNFHFII